MTTRAQRMSLRSLVVLAIALPVLVGTTASPAAAEVRSGTAGSAGIALTSAVGAAGNYMHDADAAWIRPVTARVTSKYGPRPVICNPAGCSNTFHDGVDFGSACGTPIKAVSPGRVTSATNAGSFGQRVIIDHGAGISTLYGHIQTGSFKVTVGQQVSAGTVLANVGATGVATGCHLDLKVRVGGVFVDPGPFLALRSVKL
jgi:murein DD-endopeptidase MepM/ murein hydrolase activator NlpD